MSEVSLHDVRSELNTKLAEAEARQTAMLKDFEQRVTASIASVLSRISPSAEDVEQTAKTRMYNSVAVIYVLEELLRTAPSDKDFKDWLANIPTKTLYTAMARAGKRADDEMGK